MHIMSFVIFAAIIWCAALAVPFVANCHIDLKPYINNRAIKAGVVAAIFLLFAIPAFVNDYHVHKVRRELIGQGIEIEHFENAYKSEYFLFDEIQYAGKAGGWGVSLFTLKNDPKHNFIVKIGDNTDCYVKNGVTIPVSGRVTAVFHENQATYQQSDIDMFIEIASANTNEYTFATDNLDGYGRRFYFAYNDCPVAKDWKGFLAFVDNKWLFVSRENYIANGDESAGSNVFTGFEIKDKKVIEFIETDLQILQRTKGNGA